MTVTYGFYNSFEGDRTYNASQFSTLFEGLIRDGVFFNIGDSLMVSPGTGLAVLVGSGRAWFNQTWTNNDAPISLELADPDLALPRLDMVFLETDSVGRTNRISVLTGEPSSEPVAPYLNRAPGYYIQQYPLAQVLVEPGVSEITPAKITNLIGTDPCPFITGILQDFDISALVAQWGDQWHIWTTDQELAFLSWFENLVDQLSDNQAANLQAQIDAILGTKLSEDRNYYVRKDGNDSNSGLVDNAGGAFLTIQKAVDVASALDTNGHTVTIHVGDGTYEESVILKPFIGYGQIAIRGNELDFNLVTVTPSLPYGDSSACFRTYGYGTGVGYFNYLLDYLTLTAPIGACVSVSGKESYLWIGRVNFGLCQLSHMHASNYATINLSDNYTISGNASKHWDIDTHAEMYVYSSTITILNDPTSLTMWIDAKRFSYVYVSNPIFVNKAYVTGQRYNVESNSIVDLMLTSPTYFPGDSAGATDTGGQYL